MTRLPDAFLRRPLAHRGLHDRAAGVIENAPAAFEAAIAGGYGIELDVQMSADGVPMVFHDDRLDRLTGETGAVRDRDAAALSAIPLTGSADRIAPLTEVLARIAGRAPVLVEIKDQGPRDSVAFARATGQILTTAAQDHGGTLAVMSFNPACIAALDGLPPSIARGLTTGGPEDYPDDLSDDLRAGLVGIARYGGGMSFVSHNHRHLDCPRIRALAGGGAAILCWTIRSPEEEAAARRIAGNVTFEGYRPDASGGSI